MKCGLNVTTDGGGGNLAAGINKLHAAVLKEQGVKKKSTTRSTATRVGYQIQCTKFMTRNNSFSSNNETRSIRIII